MNPQFSIQPFTNPSGQVVHRVTGKLNGQRIRENFKTEGEAVTRKHNLEREAANLAPLPAVTTRLTADQCAEAEHAYRRLAGSSLNLTLAVEFALERYTPSAQSCSVNEAFSRFLTSKRAENKRPATLRTLEQRLNRLLQACGRQLVNTIQPEQLRPLIFREHTSKVNQESDYRAFSNFFNWCVRQEFTAISPLGKIGRIKVDRDEPQVLTVPECRKLLTAAQAHNGGALVPYLVLALFAGIRPKEIERLTWADIDLPSAVVTIGAKIAKMRARRLVSLSQNAVGILAPYALRAVPIYPGNWRKGFDAVKLAAGFGKPTTEAPELKPWVMDILRHTAISMHLATYSNEGLTAAWAGNSPDIIQRHYKGLVRPADASDFWQIGAGPVVVDYLKSA